MDVRCVPADARKKREEDEHRHAWAHAGWRHTVRIHCKEALLLSREACSPVQIKLASRIRGGCVTGISLQGGWGGWPAGNEKK